MDSYTTGNYENRKTTATGPRSHLVALQEDGASGRWSFREMGSRDRGEEGGGWRGKWRQGRGRRRVAG